MLRLPKVSARAGVSGRWLRFGMRGGNAGNLHRSRLAMPPGKPAQREHQQIVVAAHPDGTRRGSESW